MGYFALVFLLLTFLSSAFGRNHFSGIVAANAAGGAGQYLCRSQDQWNRIASEAKRNGFPSIRILGFDCEALHRASVAAAAHNIRVLAGIYIAGTVAAAEAQINQEVQFFRAAVKDFGAGRFVGLTIGNEVNDSMDNIMRKVYDVRGYLRSIGISVPVSTVHTWVRIRDDPGLCGADFIGANAHTYFDSHRTSGQAGEFVFNLVVPELRKRCPGKKVYITESGWPAQGAQNGVARPSSVDTLRALSSLNCASRHHTDVELYAFEVDDQRWKHNDVERSFGISKYNLQNEVFRAC